MGWFPEMESLEWQRYAQERIEEEAQHYAEYLEQKAESDLEYHIESRERETKKAVIPRS